MPPTLPKIIPKVLVLNARSLAKPDVLPALYAELLIGKSYFAGLKMT